MDRQTPTQTSTTTSTTLSHLAKRLSHYTTTHLRLVAKVQDTTHEHTYI